MLRELHGAERAREAIERVILFLFLGMLVLTAGLSSRMHVIDFTNITELIISLRLIIMMSK